MGWCTPIGGSTLHALGAHAGIEEADQFTTVHPGSTAKVGGDSVADSR
jgi:hypothetical protein